MNNYTILIAEDDYDIRKLLRIHVENAGYEVIEACNGLEALDIINKSKVHLLLLDIMMPKCNGFEVIKKLRSNSVYIPIIVITARVEEDNKLLGLSLGSDDYICKPFSYREVISRINVQLRRNYRYNDDSQQVYENGDLQLDYNQYIVTKNGVQLYLNPKEIKLLEVFMSNPNRVFTKKQLYEKVWNEMYFGDDNTIMVHISMLRDKIEDNPKKPIYIQTIKGVGYRMMKK